MIVFLYKKYTSRGEKSNRVSFSGSRYKSSLFAWLFCSCGLFCSFRSNKTMTMILQPRIKLRFPASPPPVGQTSEITSRLEEAKMDEQNSAEN